MYQSLIRVDIPIRYSIEIDNKVLTVIQTKICYQIMESIGLKLVKSVSYNA